MKNALYTPPKIPINMATVTTTPITLNKTYDMILVDTGIGDITLNVPIAANFIGWSFTIMKITANVNKVIITPNGAETINGNPNITLYSQYEVVRIISNGTEWFIASVG